MSPKAGYPFIAKAVRRVLQTEILPDGVYPSIDPDTYEGWYDLLIWNDENIEKPSKASLEAAIDEIRGELSASGTFYPEYDVIV